jgi:hypothetical protein
MTQLWPSTGPTGDANTNRHSWHPLGARPAHPTRTVPDLRGTPLYVDDPPDSGTQWELCYRGIRRALAHQAITQTSSGRTVYRLVHTDCARRHPGAGAHDPDQHMHDA